MSGRYEQLPPGRYTLAVSEGDGPAGVHRTGDGALVALPVEGGRVDFAVPAGERVYYWWRGPEERPGVRLFGVSTGAEAAIPDTPWPTSATG